MTIGTVIRSIAIPSALATGLAFDGRYLWSCDLTGNTISQFSPQDGTIIKTFSAPGVESRGLSWDGRALWHADGGSDLAYQLSPIDGTVLYSFATGVAGPLSLAFDGRSIWLADTITNIMSQYTMDGTALKSFSLPVGGESPLGLEFADNNLLLYDNVSGLVYMIDPIDGGVIWSFSAPGATMSDIAFDGRAMWIHNVSAGLVQQISLN